MIWFLDYGNSMKVPQKQAQALRLLTRTLQPLCDRHPLSTSASNNWFTLCAKLAQGLIELCRKSIPAVGCRALFKPSSLLATWTPTEAKIMAQSCWGPGTIYTSSACFGLYLKLSDSSCRTTAQVALASPRASSTRREATCWAPSRPPSTTARQGPTGLEDQKAWDSISSVGPGGPHKA